MLDGGRLVVAHAGLIERYHGRASGRVRDFCLYGQTTGETDEYGLPVRYPWAQEYRGRAVVLYGHTPVPEPEWLNNTMCLDTGCVFGGRLTALNYPERTLVSVPAARVYHAPAKPFPVASPSSTPGPARREPDVLDIGDVSGSRVIETGYLPRIGVREAHAAAALEVMSRFAVDPRWLLYLPPTMSPVATSQREDLLEHPEQAFSAYRADGVDLVLCEEKHMGSRAVLLICRSPQAAQARFGVPAGASAGAVWTRTGRPFFPAALTATLVGQVGAAAEKAGLFDELDTSWLLLDAELLPWNVKAAQLLRDQYAALAAAARASLPAAVSVLEQAAARPLPADGARVAELLDRTRARAANADAFTAAYLRYCWPTDHLAGVRVAPFQLLASEGAVYHERPHLWHLELAARLAGSAGRSRCRGGPRADHHDPAPGRADQRPGLRRRGQPLVAGADRRRGRGHGGQARREPSARPRQARAARPQGARPGVPAAHLRPGLHRARQPGPAAPARAQPQALARPARIRPRPGGPGPPVPRRAALARPRMRLRRPGPGVRARRPPPVTR